MSRAPPPAHGAVGVPALVRRLVAVVAAVVHAVAAPPEGDALVRRAAEEHRRVGAVGGAAEASVVEDKVLGALAHPLWPMVTCEGKRKAGGRQGAKMYH